MVEPDSSLASAPKADGGGGSDIEGPATSGAHYTVATNQVPLILQTRGTLTLQVGDTLTLPCVISSLTPVGPIKWILVTQEKEQMVVWDFKSAGSSRATPIADTTQSYNRDFSIVLDITLSDAGFFFFYRVKFKKGSPKDIESSRGEGIQVVVVGCQEPTHLPDG
ncbi:signal-regulatory protein beta-1-like [Elephas maximus indicus]|uniref:signal-regulatory protein beta-1-like n=1 Tax=Elephas maximus indicus TaxID=99487 RepID=UPI0021169A29|nr:signal-regulatory protein beta-1-like [Elephas maximus indicus]